VGFGRSLPIATGLAAAAITATLAEAVGLSLLLALLTIPVALYAALATSRLAVPLALTAAAAGVGVIAYWIYALISALAKNS
jgi:hypothetical protein